MKIAVCIKQVPDSWAEKKMVDGLLDRANVDAVLNDLDEYAVEEALRIVEAHGGNEEGGPNTVTVISMGPERATEAVRKALSMGANAAVLVSDAALAGARMSVVPAMISEKLEWAQLTFASKVEVDVAAQKTSITRTTEAGVDEMSAQWPVVISVVEKINEPRYPSFKGIMAAKKKTIDVVGLATLGTVPTSSWSTVIDSAPRPARAAGVVITDDGSASQKLVDFLVEKKLI